MTRPHRIATTRLSNALAMLIEDHRHDRTTELPPGTAGRLVTRGLAQWVRGHSYTVTERTEHAYTTGNIPKTRSCHGTTWARVQAGQWAAYLPKATFTVTLSDDKTHWTLDRDGQVMRHIHTRPAEEATDIASMDVHLWITRHVTTADGTQHR